jgi:hypothetical protein
MDCGEVTTGLARRATFLSISAWTGKRANAISQPLYIFIDRDKCMRTSEMDAKALLAGYREYVLEASVHSQPIRLDSLRSPGHPTSSI